MKSKLLFAFIFAGIASLFASNNPDGLEKVASLLGFAGRETEHAALMQGYSIPFLGNTRLSGMIAGIVGVLLTFGLFRLAVLLYDRTYRQKTTP